MDIEKENYIKSRIRDTCYRYKFYLVRFEVLIIPATMKDSVLAIKCTTKDKSGFHRVIQKEYDVEDILNKLPIYLKELSFCMNPKNQVMNITKEEYVKHYKL